MSNQRVLRDLNKLNTFVRVAQRKSFSRAAQDLRATPSVISKRIKELEDELGFVVLNRSTHGVTLTDHGEGLLAHCLQLFDQMDNFVTDARRSQKQAHGTLRVQAIGDCADLMACPVVTRFLRRMPSLKLQYTATHDPSQGIEDGVDVFVSTRSVAAPGFHEIDLGPVQFSVCASPAYLEGKPRPTDPRSLKDFSCITELRSTTREWPFLIGGNAASVQVGGTLLCNGYGMMRRAALDGIGVVRVPSVLVREDMSQGLLVPVVAPELIASERLAAFYSNVNALPKKTSEFLIDLRASFATVDDRASA
jgi:DNA-binding transcriptional LysR family regulator